MDNLKRFVYGKEEIMTMNLFVKVASWNFSQNSSKIL